MSYIVEGNLNFFDELNNSLDIEENEYKSEVDDNLCLITYQPLTLHNIELMCGHKFNYTPLYLDLVNHKQKFNEMEDGPSNLNSNEIRCPYCRKTQIGLLPYYDGCQLPKIHGVNFVDPCVPIMYKMCNFLIPNANFDPNGENPKETTIYNEGNCKYLKCFKRGLPINFCSGVLKGPNYGDAKSYCCHHKKNIIQKYKMEKKEKKEQEKEQQMKEIKEHQLKMKEQQLNNVNIGCIGIIKSGTNKGKFCGCKIISENMCNRHLKNL
jgi:hypothetical protein